MDRELNADAVKRELIEMEQEIPLEQNIVAWGNFLRAVKAECERRLMIVSKTSRLLKRRAHVPPKTAKNKAAAQGRPKNPPPTGPKGAPRRLKNMAAARGLPKNPPPTFYRPQEVPAATLPEAPAVEEEVVVKAETPPPPAPEVETVEVEKVEVETVEKVETEKLQQPPPPSWPIKS